MKKGVISILSAVVGGIGGGLAVKRIKGNELEKTKEVIRKNDVIIQLFSRWLALRQTGVTLDGYFADNGYKTIAIYGMSYVGERLYEELKDTSTEVKYAIDRNAGNIFSDIEVKTLDEELEEVEAVIVTAIYFFDDIERDLVEIFDCPIISLEDIIDDLQI